MDIRSRAPSVLLWHEKELTVDIFSLSQIILQLLNKKCVVGPVVIKCCQICDPNREEKRPVQSTMSIKHEMKARLFFPHNPRAKINQPNTGSKSESQGHFYIESPSSVNLYLLLSITKPFDCPSNIYLRLNQDTESNTTTTL